MRWPLQKLQPFQQTQLQPPFGQSVASLCHPWFTTTNFSYRFPIFETSATALCGTTGICIWGLWGLSRSIHQIWVGKNSSQSRYTWLIGYKVTGIPKISQVDRLVGIKRMRLRMMNSNSGLSGLVQELVHFLKTHQDGSSIDAKTSCSMLFRIVSSVPNSVPQITAWNVHYCPASMTERFYMMSVIPLPVHKLPSATCPSFIFWFQIPRHSHLYIACLHKLAMGHGDINLVLRLWHEWLSQETGAQPQCRENGWDVLKRLYPLVI